MNFSQFLKRIGIFILILLAGYGALVTYFDVAEGKERSKIVLNLEDLDLDLDSLVGEKLEDSLNLEQGQVSSASSQVDSSDKVASLEAGSEPASSEEKVSEPKATFSGDLQSLDLSKEGMEGALPENIESANQGSSENKTESKKKKLDPQTKKRIEDYFIVSSKIDFPEDEMAPFEAITEVVRKDNPEKINQLISEFRSAYEEFKKLQPPQKLQSFHDNSLKAFQLYIDLLVQIRETKDLAETVKSKKAKELDSVVNFATTQLKELNTRYDLELPDDVLTESLSQAPTQSDGGSAPLSEKRDQNIEPTQSGVLAAIDSDSSSPDEFSDEEWQEQEEEVAELQESDDSVGMQCGGGTIPKTGIGPTMKAECCEGCCEWCVDENGNEYCCEESCEMKCDPYAYIWDSVTKKCGCAAPDQGGDRPEDDPVYYQNPSPERKTNL